MQTEFEPLMTSEETAQLLGIHPKTLQQMAREGKVPAVRIGKFWRFRKSDLDTWVRASVNCGRYAYRSEQETV
jgi:excisionase family DNA binding protein